MSREGFPEWHAQPVFIEDDLASSNREYASELSCPEQLLVPGIDEREHALLQFVHSNVGDTALSESP